MDGGFIQYLGYSWTARHACGMCEHATFLRCVGTPNPTVYQITEILPDIVSWVIWAKDSESPYEIGSLL